MRLLFASDSFKESLTSAETAKLLETAAKTVFGEGVSCRSLLIADGGEGTVRAVVAARGGKIVPAAVRGPLSEMIEAEFGALSETEAILEIASACGLSLLPKEKRDPAKTTSFGAGELMKAALDRGFRKITVALGGSATNDGGMGFAAALGARFLDAAGRELEGCGENLERIARIDLGALDSRLVKTDLTVLCDVKNPLCGENGATYVFGPQKGGTPQILEQLERGMEHYHDLLTGQFGADPNDIPGSGAAGGLGAALTLFFGAKMRPGIETVLDLVQFDSILRETDLVVTGEGRCDRSSAFGKAMQGVGDRAKRAGVPAIAVCGGLGEGYEAVFGHGIRSIFTLTNENTTAAEAMERAEELYLKTAIRAFRSLTKLQ